MTDRVRERLALLVLIGALALNFPVLAIFNQPATVAGIPILYVYVFAAWAAGILVVYLVVRRQ